MSVRDRAGQGFLTIFLLKSANLPKETVCSFDGSLLKMLPG